MMESLPDIQQKLLGAVGLATRARGCIIGTTLCVDTMRAGKGHLLLVAGDVSENTRKRLIKTAEFHKIPYAETTLEKQMLAHAAGKKADAASVLFTEPGFVKIVEKYGIKIHTTNTEVLDLYGSNTEV